MTAQTGYFKEKLGNFFEKVADRSSNSCVHLVWGDESEMPKCLMKDFEDDIE